MEENSNEGGVEPIGSDWLVTDRIHQKREREEGGWGWGSVTRQQKSLNRILRPSDLLTGTSQFLAGLEFRERRMVQTHEHINKWRGLSVSFEKSSL